MIEIHENITKAYLRGIYIINKSAVSMFLICNSNINLNSTMNMFSVYLALFSFIFRNSKSLQWIKYSPSCFLPVNSIVYLSSSEKSFQVIFCCSNNAQRDYVTVTERICQDVLRTFDITLKIRYL